jgi:hypothetical protein
LFWGLSCRVGQLDRQTEDVVHICGASDALTRRCVTIAFTVFLLGFQVAEVYTDHATITSKGKQISRNATEDNPAYRVERHGKGSGNPVIKKHSELHKFEGGEEVCLIL